MKVQHAELYTDDQLLQLLRNGATAERGFKLLMQQYRERLYWQIRRIVQVHADADDVLQNTFIKAFRGLDTFEGKSKLSTWLYRIATNEAISFCQSRNRKPTDSLDEHAFPLANLESHDLPDADVTAQILSEAVESLPEKQRVVFNMRYFDETPYEEMSRMLDTSVGALKASFHHAVKKVERFITDKEI